MTPDLNGLLLTEHQQWAVTIGWELEQMGWVAAANALRRKHFPSLPWETVAKVHGATTHAGWLALFRTHRGSHPPLSDFTPAAKPSSTTPPQPITPAARPEQTIAT